MLEALIAGQRDPRCSPSWPTAMRAKIPALTEALRGVHRPPRVYGGCTSTASMPSRRHRPPGWAYRRGNQILSTHPRTTDEHPGLFQHRRRCVHRRNRCGHECVPHRRSPGVVGRGVPAATISGRVKSGATRPGNRHLKAALGVAALAASRSKNTYYAARYRRIAGTHRPAPTRGNKNRHSSAAQIALVSLQHKMLTDAWHMLANGAFYRDPGPDYYTRHQPGKTKTRAIKQLEPSATRHSQTPHRRCLTPVDSPLTHFGSPHFRGDAKAPRTRRVEALLRLLGVVR